MSKQKITPKTFDKCKFYTSSDVGPAYICAIIAPYAIAILVLLGGLVALNAGLTKEQLDESVLYQVFSYLASPIGFCIMFFAFNKIRNKSIAAAKVKFKIGIWNMVICFVVPIVCVFGFNYFIGGIDHLLEMGGYQISELQLPLDHFGWYVLSLIVIALLPAIFEELIFRGIIQNGLVRRLGEVGALFMSAFLFALMHGSIQQFIYPFILGVILGWIAMRTGSTFSSMLVHFLNNAIVVTLNYIAERTGANMTFEYNAWQWVLSVALVFVAAAIIFVIERYYFKHKNKVCYKEEQIEQPEDPPKGKVPILVWVGIAISAVLLIINTITNFLPPAA